MRERTRLENGINAVRQIESQVKDNIDLIELAEIENDQSILNEAEKALFDLREEANKRGLESLLSGELDGNDAFLQVNAGAGGTEACDWAGMLFRMYCRWAESRGFRVILHDKHDGDGAGIKSATVEIQGENVYGWLKSEAGVHRLVRISPFDANARRHTSFSSVSVSPVVDDEIDIKVDEKDIKVDTYRASGAGGQHVNRTDSAVRFTHIPTGIVVACQSERSQHKNRDHAMKMLKAKLYELEVRKREAEQQAIESAKTDISWGHQIRSYVLHPYQMVKDLRTGVETSDSDGVLDGDIDRYLEAALALKLVDPKNKPKVSYEDLG